MTDKITLHTPLDIVQAVPLVVGYYPTESVVMLILNDHKLVHVAMRFDLADVTEDVTGAAQKITGFLAATPAATGPIAMAVFSIDQEAGRSVAQNLITALGTRTIHSATLASLNGYTWIDPEQPEAVQWTNAYPAGLSPVQAAIIETGAGDTLTRTLAELVEPYDGSAPSPVTADQWASLYRDAIAEAQGDDFETAEQLQTRWVHEIADWLSAHIGDQAELAPEQAAWLAARITNLAVRDAAVALMHSEETAAHLKLWTRVADCAGATEPALPALTLASLAAWLEFSGTAAANVLYDRAEHIQGASTYGLLQLLRTMLDGSMDPRTWEGVRSAMYDRIFPPF